MSHTRNFERDAGGDEEGRRERSLAGQPSPTAAVYGGRPRFGVVRRETADGPTLTLYELLPTDRVAARRRRLERAGSSESVVTAAVVSVFPEADGDGEADSEATVSRHETVTATDATPPAAYDWSSWTAVKIRRLAGGRVGDVTGLLRETLAAAGVEPGAVSRSGQGHAAVPETAGIRLALAFLAVKPLRRPDRRRAVVRGVGRLTDEECLYWYGTCRTPTRGNGVKALRTLLADDAH